MKSVLESCEPRASILQGTFNPEVFTASLGAVMDHYQSGSSTADTIYTNAETFFRDATYPTQGMRDLIPSVFRRIGGDAGAPSMYRLETSFGGGKTHTLIALTHIAHRGKELAGVSGDIIDPQLLPEPHSIKVVGIAGDEIPVTRQHGDRLTPYTLWGELAYQIGGEGLYREVEEEAQSFAAPGKNYLERVLGGNRILIMLDELAQYAARLEAARTDGSAQLSAFLMSLGGYAKNHTGIVVVMTLAGMRDAFAHQTEQIADLISKITGEDVEVDDAVAMGERAVAGVTSVVMRDASAFTPVKASEISAVLAKRLFETIEEHAARETANGYAGMYQRNQQLLPEEATSINFVERMVSNYPFHPTLVDFLNNKLAEAENFQGTRGVLRVLALTVRSIWQRRDNLLMIHASDIDMTSSLVTNEILGRTGSSDLQVVLNADIGSTDSHNLQGGLSNAQQLDRSNPHPDGRPLYEMTWKDVFLNSLVGRAEGNTSNVFGVTEAMAIFEVSTPVVTPPQVREALSTIENTAYYLRHDLGKYFASVDPTVNSILARIRGTITESEVQSCLKDVSRDLVHDGPTFRVENDVRYPQDIADNKDIPTLAVVALDAGTIRPMDFFQMRGDAMPRIRQNMIVLLVPKTVAIDLGGSNAGNASNGTREYLARVRDIAVEVLAMRKLDANPRAYGVTQGKLKEANFRERASERGLALTTSVSGMYSTMAYPNGNTVIRKELRTIADEGGAAIIGHVTENLKDKLLTNDDVKTSILQQIGQIVFAHGIDHMSADDVLGNFYRNRSWPMPSGRNAVDKVIREGVARGNWVIYQMGDDPNATSPALIYTQERTVPASFNVLGNGVSLMTIPGAKQRGWLDSDKPKQEDVESAVRNVLHASGAATVADVVAATQEQMANADSGSIKDAVRSIVSGAEFSLYEGDPNQSEKPSNLVDGYGAAYHEIKDDEVIISRAQQSERGWSSARSEQYKIEGREHATHVMGVLRRAGSIYTRSRSTATIDSLELAGLSLPDGGKLRIQLRNAGPAAMKQIDELLQILGDVVEIDDETNVRLTIAQPDANDALIQELQKADE